MIAIEKFRDIRSSNHLIVLDTNILLELYRQPANISIDVIDALKCIIHKLYVPRDVYDEYIRNYQKICGSEKKKYQKVSGELTELVKMLKESISSKTNGYRKHNYTDISKLQNDLNKKIDEVLQIIEIFEHDHKTEIDFNLEFLKKDSVKEFVNLLEAENKIGNIVPFSEKISILQEGQVRFDNLIPPGYKDCGKKGIDKYGDLIIWKNIIKVAKEQSVNILFVCNDVKEDWWEKDGETPIDLRKELLMEFKENNTSLGIHFLTLDKFFFYISEELQLSNSKSSLQLSANDDARVLLDEYIENIDTKVRDELINIDIEKELEEKYLETDDEEIYWEIDNVSVEKEEKVITYYIDLDISVVTNVTYIEPGEYQCNAGVVALDLNGKVEIIKEEYSTNSNIKKLVINYIEMRHIEPEIWSVLKTKHKASCKKLIKDNDLLERLRLAESVEAIIMNFKNLEENLDDSKMDLYNNIEYYLNHPEEFEKLSQLHKLNQYQNLLSVE